MILYPRSFCSVSNLNQSRTSSDLHLSSESTCSLERNQSASDLSESLTCSLSDTERAITYAVLIASCVALNLLRGALFYLVCINASRVLHNRMFATILRVPVLFFDNNPSGNYRTLVCVMFSFTSSKFAVQ